jgi:hypothetical protein
VIDSTDRKLVMDEIYKKKEETARKYDKLAQKGEEAYSFPELYGLLAEVGGSFVGYDELRIQLLKNNLKSDFFKTSVARADNGYIVFSNDDFEVMFSKSLIKTIKVKYKKAGFPLLYRNMLHNNILEVVELLEKYLKDKSFRNLKALANCGKEKTKNPISILIRYLDTYKYATWENLDFIKQKIKNEELRKKSIEENNKEYEEGQKYAKAFLDSIYSDLEQFEVTGWQIDTSGIREENGDVNYPPLKCITF